MPGGRGGTDPIYLRVAASTEGAENYPQNGPFFEWWGLTGHRSINDHVHAFTNFCKGSQPGKSTQAGVPDKGIPIALHGGDAGVESGVAPEENQERFWAETYLWAPEAPYDERTSSIEQGGKVDIVYAYTDTMVADEWRTDENVPLRFRYQADPQGFSYPRDLAEPLRIAGRIVDRAVLPAVQGKTFEPLPAIGSLTMHNAWFDVPFPEGQVPANTTVTVTWKHGADVANGGRAFLAVNPVHGILGRYAARIEGAALNANLTDPYADRGPQGGFNGFFFLRRDESLDFVWAANEGPHPFIQGDMLVEWIGEMNFATLPGYGAGNYKFYVEADDGYQIWLDQADPTDDVDQQLPAAAAAWAGDLSGLVDIPATNGSLVEERPRSGLSLQVPFRVRYYRRANGPGRFRLLVSKDNGAPVPVPAAAFVQGFSHAQGGTTPVLPVTAQGANAPEELMQTFVTTNPQGRFYLWLGAANGEVNGAMPPLDPQELTITLSGFPPQTVTRPPRHAGYPAPSTPSSGEFVIPVHILELR
jgi:hypothetical protein